MAEKHLNRLKKLEARYPPGTDAYTDRVRKLRNRISKMVYIDPGTTARNLGAGGKWFIDAKDPATGGKREQGQFDGKNSLKTRVTMSI